jgi:hypothetical protein
MKNNEPLDQSGFGMSQGSLLRKKSYSTSKLQLENKNARDKEYLYPRLVTRKFSKAI